MDLVLQAIKSNFRKIEANRTHYDTREIKTIIYTFDGILEGKEAVYIGSDAYYVKLSNEVFSLETYIGWEMTRNDGSKISVLEDSIYEYSSGCYAVEEYTFAVIVPESANPMGVTLGKGVWLFYCPGSNYVESMRGQYVNGELKRLDEKYLPENIVNAPTIAAEAKATAIEAQSLADTKMDRNNPVGTGSFSLNRRANTTIGYCSHAEGYQTTASGENSHAEGGGTTASGEYSHSGGRVSIASGYEAFVHGDLATASGDHSFAIGTIATASGKHSTAIGQHVTAASENQFVHGRFNIIDNGSKYLHIVGNGNIGSYRSNAHTLDWNGLGWFAGGLKVGGTSQDDTNAKEVALKDDIPDVSTKMDKNNPVGTGSFSMNRQPNTVIGNYSHAEGYWTAASGDYSHAEGIYSVAPGNYSHAEGYNAHAEGDISHAEGTSNALGSYSHSEGKSTALGKCQHTQGEFNIVDPDSKYAHIVGNGYSQNDRSNAHTLDWNGLGWFAGGLKIGGTSQDDANAKEVALKEDIPDISNLALKTEIPNVDSYITTHNTSTASHNDIRDLITGLTNRLNALADSDDTTLDQLSEIVTYIKSNKELIDAITTSKVNIGDIVDNLTTNVSNKPLSAAQGVALKALIDAITVPTKVSELTNDSGYLTSYTETDPTVPAWAKAASKPTYTATEVGADATGTANSVVSTHNTSTDAHNDIREELANKMNQGDNADSATKLQTARKINGIAFDGTADIVVPSSVKIGIITLTANGWVEDATLGAFKQTAAIPNLANGHKVDLDADLNTINQLPASIVPYNDNGTFYAVTLTPPSVDIAVQYTLLAVDIN